ncbi:hypothetical protein BX661DRAFT_181932, partial [Kickxella alabastrina]|uniref:uncharacterized protein n=1 Tax=Kickxella alabastrina TaxID=61397 RepID=UPI00221E7CC7
MPPCLHASMPPCPSCSPLVMAVGFDLLFYFYFSTRLKESRVSPNWLTLLFSFPFFSSFSFAYPKVFFSQREWKIREKTNRFNLICFFLSVRLDSFIHSFFFASFLYIFFGA